MLLNKVANDTNASVPGLPDFFGTKYQNGEKYTKRPQNISIGHKIFPIAVK
jgi:hypothetical protein